MAKCNELTPLPFKELNNSVSMPAVLVTVATVTQNSSRCDMKLHQLAELAQTWWQSVSHALATNGQQPMH